MQEQLDDSSGQLRALVRLGGLSIGRYQVDLALGLGCERIICLAPALAPELVALQQLVEFDGGRFHVLPGCRALAGLITAGDEVLAIADGLFVSAQSLPTILSSGSAVMVQPIEQGLADGFERIDLNHASAGLIRVPGRLIAGLADLPDDCDPFSALQRIALQAGVPQKMIPAIGDGVHCWTLVSSQAQADLIEPEWLAAQTPTIGEMTPSAWLAARAVRGFGADLLNSAGGLLPLMLGAAVLVVLGLVAGWIGQIVIGLVLCGCAWIVWKYWEVLQQIDQGRRFRRAGFGVQLAAFPALFDAAFVALCAWGLINAAATAGFEHYFPPLMLAGLLRLVPKLLVSRRSAWLEDRGLACVIVATGMAAHYGSELIYGAALILALAGIALPRAKSGLTRV